MLRLEKLEKRLASFHLEPLDLTVEEGDYTVLLGPSGVGKTVLLELVAGLIRPDAGRISWREEDLTAAPPEGRGFSLVYQDYALFEHMTVLDNIAYGPRCKGATRKAARDEAAKMAERLGIEGLLQRSPSTLSGGEQQRVALTRALASRPRLLLLDEPLAAVDPRESERLREVLHKMSQETGTTCLHVTHNIDEALKLGKRIGVMLDGALIQVSTPEELFRSPSDPRVAEFLGLRNILPIEAEGEGSYVVCNEAIHAGPTSPSAKHLWVRPEDVILSREPFDSSARNQFRCRVESITHRGHLVEVKLRTGSLELSALITGSSLESLAATPGDTLHCTFKSTAIHVF